MNMPSFLMAYLWLWMAACLVAVGILYRDRKSLHPELGNYARFLFVPWKIATFLPALLFVTFAGRFTDDETWDVVSGAGMSILTYLTAPWALGLFYKSLKNERPKRYLLVACVLCLFSSSWFYDGYLLWRDGEHSIRWLSNLMLSPIIYVAAGFLWNLEVTTDGRFTDPEFTLSFLRDDWPVPPGNTSFRPLILPAIPLILIASFVLTAFVGWHF
jgi:hypothetical protein